VLAQRSRRVLLGLLALTLAATSAACTSSGGTDDAAPSPGVTDDVVKVGYQVVDLGALSSQLGFKTVDQGTYENRVKGIQAIVSYVNANGGLGGRQIEATIQQYSGPQDAPDYAEAQCKALTQDAQVFGVVMDGQFQNNVRPCFAASRTVMLDQTLIAQDTTAFEQFAPYYFMPTVPEYGSYILTELDVLKNQTDYFNGSSGVSVVAPDTEVTRRIVDSLVLPKLREYGLTNSAAQYVDSSNVGTLGAGATAALQATQAAGLDRLMVVGGARILPTLFADSLVRDLDARYTISSFDNPAFFVDNQDIFFPERLVGMVGLGFMPALDLRKNPDPFPSPERPNEGLCKQIIDQAGAAPPEPFRENYRTVMQTCDSTLLLKAAFDRLPKGTAVTGATFRDAVWGAGPAWSGATVPTPAWPQGSYSGVSQGRGMYWDTACVVEGAPAPGCYLYGLPPTPLTPAAAVPAAPAATAGTAPQGTAPQGTAPVGTALSG
jgi:hypothetical protein